MKTHTDCDTTDEGYDYRMEEANKAFKENLHTKEPTIEDWSLVCSRLVKPVVALGPQIMLPE